MKKVCAWCGTQLGEHAGEPAQLVSHGICGECATVFEAPDGDESQRFLDSLGAPVLVLDADARICAASAPARQALSGLLPEVRGRLTGDALDCVNARLPGGCGRTARCQACVIRATVAHTSTTGTGHHRVETWREVKTAAGLQRRRVAISTELVGAVVLLRLDELELLDPEPAPSGGEE